MKFTCLNEGRGYYFPPSYILDVGGFRILLDCPLDISALTIFSPVTTHFHSQLANQGSHDPSMDMEFEIQKSQKIEQPLDKRNFIHAEPWYKTVTNLHLWDPSSIDIVLISSMMGMLGLPFLTRNEGFSAKIYATEATASLGQLMMKDLVSMHLEFVHIYGSYEPSFPQWLKWEELELLPAPLKEIAFGKDGLELGGWMPLYSSEDVRVCIQKVETLRYAEETCYNGALILKAFSSGLEIGSCNWTIDSADGDIAFVSSSMLASHVAMEFNYHALRGKDLILYSDFSAIENMEDAQHDSSYNAQTMDPLSTLSDGTVDCNNLDEYLLSSEMLEERDKLAFICSCIVESIRAGGSVLVALIQPSISFQLLEQIPDYFESSAMKVPVYVISSTAAELLAFTNIIPEWLCKQRQEKLFSCQSLFSYAQPLKENKLHLFPSVHSTELLTNWQEPCVIFAPHWSLRLGPVVHLLQRWHGDKNSLLVLEKCVDAEMSLLPFKPMEMKVLECSFLSGLRLPKIHHLLEMLQPKILLFPGQFKEQIKFSSSTSRSFSILYFNQNDTIDVPRMKEGFDLEIEAQLATQFVWKKQDDRDITRLEGQLYVSQGKHWLFLENKLASTVQSRSLINWGIPDLERLLVMLSNMGMNASIDKAVSDAEAECAGVIHVQEPNSALIEFHSTKIIVTAPDENLAKLISEAVTNILDEL